MLGADGVVVGTRLWASAEALTPQAHTDKAIDVTGDSTIRTKVLDALRGTPWPKEYSFRFLKNKLTDEWASRENEAFSTLSSMVSGSSRFLPGLVVSSTIRVNIHALLSWVEGERNPPLTERRRK
jgi:NAD(P)H-dependent flavin oxidoreductase YrpB (nitropropane dioxygenase family)